MVIGNNMNNLMIDFYEFTMGQVYFDSGKKDTIACFDLFFRKCPDNASFIVANGIDKCLQFLENFKFSNEEIDYLRQLNTFSDDYLEYLSSLRFSGEVTSVKDGEVVFPNEPVLTVKAPIIEAQLVETALLLIINHMSLITTKASRIVRSAGGRSVMEFGSRRAHGFDAANLGATCACVAGAVGTACTIAGFETGVKVLGTMAHSFVQSFASEFEAFKAYALSFPDNAVLLVDTYDTLNSGIPNVIRVNNEILKPMGKSVKGIRIDSGDLAYLSKMARNMLDEAEMEDTEICVSNSLDEYLIHDLISQGAPINFFGVGENMITSKSSPVLSGVYKLCQIIEDDKVIPTMKISDNIGKITNPAEKDVIRLFDSNGKIITDVITLKNETIDSDSYTLIDPENTWKTKTITNFTAKNIRDIVMLDGKRCFDSVPLDITKKYLKEELKTLWEENLRLYNSQTFIVSLSSSLLDLKNDILHKHKNFKDKL